MAGGYLRNDSLRDSSFGYLADIKLKDSHGQMIGKGKVLGYHGWTVSLLAISRGLTLLWSILLRLDL